MLLLKTGWQHYLKTFSKHEKIFRELKSGKSSMLIKRDDL